MKLYYYYIILLTIILMWFCCSKNNSERDLFYNSHFSSYINNVDTYMYPVKLPNTISRNTIDFKIEYLENIITIPIRYKNYLNGITAKVLYNFTRCGLDNLNERAPWKYLMSVNNLEMNMPFTLGDYIIISNNMLGDGNNKIISADTIIETIIHERLHIIQRRYQEKFNDFYRRNYDFIMNEFPLYSLPGELKKTHMTNPDSNFKMWTYDINNKEYIPLLVFKNNALSQIGYNINNHNDQVKLNKQTSYHPNEKFAHEVAHKIFNNRLDYQTKEFLKSL